MTTFSQNEEIHSLAVNDLCATFENSNITCAATITFAESDFKNQLKMLRVRLCLHDFFFVRFWFLAISFGFISCCLSIEFCNRSAGMVRLLSTT